MTQYTAQFKLAKTIELIEQLKGGYERRMWWQDAYQLIDLMTEGHLVTSQKVCGSIEKL